MNNFKTIHNNTSETELISLAKEGNVLAINMLLKKYEPTIKTNIKRFKGVKNVDEYYTIGQEALLTAVKKFDFTKKTTLSTVLYYEMQNLLNKYNFYNTHYTMSERMYKDNNEVRKAIEVLAQEFQYAPNADEIIEYLVNNNIFTKDKAEDVVDIYFTNSVTSLDTPLGEEDDSTLLDMCGENDYEYEEDVARTDVMAKSCNDFLSHFNETEQFIIRCKFGLEGDDMVSSTEIAKVLNCARQNIDNRFKTIVKKIELMKEAGYRPAFFIEQSKFYFKSHFWDLTNTTIYL